jgi:hypothetical protein
MFFRRQTPHVQTFNEHIDNLKKLGFTVESQAAGKVKVSRKGIGAVVEDMAGQPPHVNKAGLLIHDEIGLLVNGGYQMFWRTPSGRRVPALAPQLKELHAFQEDLREGLGLTSLYNESLGTTSDLHLYDRVEERDAGDSHKPWLVAHPVKTS